MRKLSKRWALRLSIASLACGLACNHERVDLGGYAGGSSTPTPTRALPAQMVPPAPTSTTPIVTTSMPRFSPMLVTQPSSPFTGLESRATLMPPMQGGTLAVATDGSVAVAADPDRDALYVVDLVSTLVHNVALPGGSEAGRTLLDDMGQAHVVLRSLGKLARIELGTKQLTLSEVLCQQPRGLAYAAGTKTLHVACADGQLLQLSAADYKEQAREQRELDLRDIVVKDDGTRIVARFRSAQLLWLSPSGEQTRSAPVRPWPKLARAGSSNGSGNGSSNGSASAATLEAVDTSATFAFRLQSTRAGVWMLHERAQLSALDADGTYHGQDTGCGPVVQPALSLFARPDEEPSTRVDLQLQGVAAPALDVAFSPGQASWVAIATPAALSTQRATVQLQRTDTLQKQALIRERDEPSGEFKGTAATVCQQPAFVALGSGSQAIAVAFDQSALLYVQNRYPARLDVYEPQAPDAASGGGNDVSARLTKTITLANDAIDTRDLGHEWFHAELGTSRVSCAACHAEGLDDAHTWLTSAGPRRTPSLRGGIKSTAPFFWDGQFASFDQLLSHVITRQVAAPNISEKASLALLDWLDRLAALSLTTSAPAAVRGKALFESSQLGCTSCHSGPRFTDNQSVRLDRLADADDAGVVGVADMTLQVPSLLGLALRAPYMHDGCAPDLAYLFSQPACARAVHHKLAAMSGEDAAALQAYLLSL